MAGYTRQDTTGQLANGNPIDADIFNDEYDAIEGAFNASSGHNHDGTTGGGAPIESIGPSQELVVESSAVFPKVDNLVDSGKSGLRWRNGYFGTDVQVGQDVTVTRDVSVGRDLTVTGDATINGNTVVGNAASDTVTINADVASNLVPDASGTRNLGTSTSEWNNLFLDGTANVDFLTVDEDATVTGDLAVTGATGIDGDFDINTTKVTIAAATGNTSIAGTLSVNDVVAVTDLTSSTSTGTGAIVVSGGVGVQENLNVGGDLAITGTLNVTGDVTLPNVDVTTLDVSGAVGIDGNFDIGTTQFTVDASNGNTSIAGTLDVTGDTTVENLTVNGNTVLGDAITDTVTVNTNATTHSIIPAADSTYDLGDASTYWQHGYIDAITTTGDVGVGGDVTITGDLTVQGTTTTVNSTTVDIADLNITVASGAASAAAANGGGITVAGANATLTYDSTTDRWDMNKDLEVANVHADLTGDVKASDGTTVLTAGNGVTPATFAGSVDGILGGTTPAAVTGTTIQFNTGLTDGTTTITGFADEDDMTSNSATLIPTQQSVKAYVDAAVAGDGSGDIEVDTVDATTVDLGGGTGWTITQNGTTLEFRYNGAVQAKLTSTGTFQVNDDVEAEAF